MDDTSVTRSAPKPSAYVKRLVSTGAHSIPRPRTATEASALVLHEWGEASTLAAKIEMLAAAFDGTLASIKELDVPADEVQDFCQFLRDEMASLYSDARRIEHRLNDAARVLSRHERDASAPVTAGGAA
jgi:hypothetical protein